MLISKTFHDVPSTLNPKGRPVRIFVLAPDVPNYPKAKFPGVVVFSEIYQVTGPVERFAGQIASHGYVVACPSCYHEFEGPEPIPYDTDGTDRGNKYKVEKRVAAYDEDATLSVDLLCSLKNCNGSIAATGMCLGGHLAFRAAFNPRISSSVCFFATDIHSATLGLGKSDDTLVRVRNGDLKGKELVMIFGKQDTHVPREGRDLIRKTLEDADFLEVQAQHAFIRDESSKGRWDAALTRSLFSFMIEVFERTVGRDLGPRVEQSGEIEHDRETMKTMKNMKITSGAYKPCLVLVSTMSVERHRPEGVSAEAMASRRLAISSLLCDDDVPQDGRPSPQAASRSYASSVRSAFVSTLDPYTSVQHENQLHRQQQTQSHRHTSPTYQRSTSPRNENVAPYSPVPISPTLHLAPARRRTPSSFPVSYSISPTDHIAPYRYGRHVEDEGEQEEFPRLGVAYHPHATQPHPYSQLPSLSTPPVNIHESRHDRRTSFQTQINPPNYPPVLPPSTLSGPLQPPSASSPILSHSAKTATHIEGAGGNSPVMQDMENAPQCSAASLSPTVPVSAPFSSTSGLDVLVQAAAEERERIDVHRRLSGCDDPQRSFSSRLQHSSMSPVAFQGDMNLQTPSSIPPYSAPTDSGTFPTTDQSEIQYRGHILDENNRASKRRRSSLEPRPTELPPAQEIYYDPTTAVHAPIPRFDSNSATASSSRTKTHLGAADNLETSIPSWPSSVTGPSMESTTAFLTRRSPPRSKQRPRKPGSVALADMEREFREVVLSVRSYTNYLTDTGEDRNQQEAPKLVQSERMARPRKQTKSSRESQMLLSLDEVGAVDDEQDVDEFFLSAFDSPRSPDKQIKSQSKVIDDERSHFAEEDKQSPSSGLKSQKSSKHSTQRTSSTTKLNYLTPDVTDDMSDYLLTRSFGGKDTQISGHSLNAENTDADLLDELADAAGAITSEDDRTELDDQETDAIEVDVEDELLSLVDGPSEPASKSYHHLPTFHMHGSHAMSQSRLTPDAFDRMSMPPPGVVRAVSTQTKESKRGSSKPKAKRKTRDASEAVKSNKETLSNLEELNTKVTKSKSGMKQRQLKATASGFKATKSSKTSVTPVPTSLPAFPVLHSSTSVQADEYFPIVTSSGRMVTKSRKSAAAGQSSLSRKKPTASQAVGDGNNSRSRSHSTMPRASVDPEAHREKSVRIDEEKSKEVEEAMADNDDKVYCICKTKYDEDRVMIACDRCDEWYHTACVKMPDLEIDLVDQFVCPNCVAQNPSLRLSTTYKQRCFTGLSHPKPNSSDACHKPSRGAYSKYCSDECGVKHLHRKIQAWVSKGGDVRGLWETVKDVRRREGFVIREPGRTLPKRILAELQNGDNDRFAEDAIESESFVDSSAIPWETKNSIVNHLETRLQDIVRERETRKRELEVIAWRERLLLLAAGRAENVHECGWDQRLCFGEEEWMDFGEGVFESYGESTPNGFAGDGGDVLDMQVDEQVADGEWWCRGKKKCERHAGWQKLRAAEIKIEKEAQEETLVKLTTREREIRSRIEDILHPQSHSTVSGSALKYSFKLTNGSDSSMKKGKKLIPLSS
ncbi:hypothetical protein EW145_g4324 [Phellinidium pouzarii]|uniref:PHD-type domain-containing protein n=1 Tax=Phellinidium pouzarii TaxID=167371 RepID=A0A4S4L918_9AGAM|nr:hypothetical protein EW145_g4324 [Phellinidium pouzarii]